MFKGYRTIILAVITVILGALQAATGVVPAEYVGVVAMLIGIGNFALRFVTDSPVFTGKDSG